MTSVAAVDPLSKTNAHHITLEPADGTGTRYGLVLSPNANAITRRPKAGGSYVPYTQNDWSGGRGLKLATDDRSRFGDSKRLNTRRPGQITLGGLETYTTGQRVAEQFMPADAGGLTWQFLTGANRFIAYKVTISANGNRARVYFWVRRRGTPGTLSARLKNNNAGDPGTEAKLVSVTTSDIDDTISLLYEFTFSSVQAVTAAQVYWVELSGASTDTATDHWEAGMDAARTNAATKASPTGVDGTWTNPTYDLYFRLVDDTDIAGAIPFTYKSQLYLLTRPTATAAPKLYINGYRGVATGAGQSRTVLKDTTLNAPTGSLVGSLLYIVEGPNSEWQQPYRTILANDNTAKTITTDAFGRDHVASETVYAILGTKVWTEITGHGLTVLPTAIVDAGEVCYFAQGDSVKMRKMREYINSAVWTREFAEENNYATLLATYKHSTNGLMVVKANNAGNDGAPSFAQARAESWWTRLKFPQLIDGCEATTGWTFGANVTGSLDTGFYQTKTKSIKAVKAAGSPTTTPFAYRAFTQYSINAFKQRAIRFWVSSSDNLVAGDLKVRFSQATDCSTTLQDVDVPACPYGEFTQVTIPYNDINGGMLFMTSFGFISARNLTFWIDGIELVPDGSETPLGRDGGRVNGIEIYGDPTVPWVLRSGDIGSIENGAYNPIPLREYANMENVHNGMGHLVHDVYLYASFLQGVEEYYRANLDDVGPNKDEGMPQERQGYITSMANYPDRFLTNYDAGTGGYSSILSRKGGGWHEDYRCDTPGKRIRAIFLQVIPGDMADRLWFSEGEDIGFLPMPGNTGSELTDSTYAFTHEGALELAWIGDDQARLFSSVKLGLENVSAARPIEWDYKLDEAATWTPVATPFTTGPTQKINLNVTGKRLKLRFRAQTNDNSETPRITSINVSTTEQPETRYAYSMTFVYSDNGRDLLGNAENYSRAETLIAQLDTWSAAKTALTMHSQSETFDNKTVFLEPTPINPLANVAPEQQEKLSGTLTCVEPE